MDYKVYRVVPYLKKSCRICQKDDGLLTFCYRQNNSQQMNVIFSCIINRLKISTKWPELLPRFLCFIRIFQSGPMLSRLIIFQYTDYQESDLAKSIMSPTSQLSSTLSHQHHCNQKWSDVTSLEIIYCKTRSGNPFTSLAKIGCRFEFNFASNLRFFKPLNSITSRFQPNPRKIELLGCYFTNYTQPI